MFYSHCLVSRNGPLRALWLAAYCFKKLKKSQVTATDISLSVDKILEDEFNVVTYRVLAFLLLGVVRIYSKKVEYLHDDCNKVLLKIRDYVHKFKDSTIMETLRAPYFSITLPERFELDAFDLDILEDTTGCNVVPHEEITLKDNTWKSWGTYHYSVDKHHCEEFDAFNDACFSCFTLNEDVPSCHQTDFDMEEGTACNGSKLQARTKKRWDNMFSQHDSDNVNTFSEVEEEPPDPVKSLSSNNHQTEGEHKSISEVVGSDQISAELSRQDLLDDVPCQDACVNAETFDEAEEDSQNHIKPLGKYHQTDGKELEAFDIEMHQAQEQCIMNDIEARIVKLQESRFFQEALMDIEKFDGALKNLKRVDSFGNLQAGMENLQDNLFSHLESGNVETCCRAEEMPQESVELSSDNNQIQGEHKNIPETMDSDQMAVEASMQELLDDVPCQDVCVNVETFDEAEEESQNPVKSFGHQTDGQEPEASDIEMHEVIQEQCDRNDNEGSVEKLQETNFSQETGMDIEKFCVAEKSQQHTGELGEEHQSDAELSGMTFSGSRRYQVVTRDYSLSTIRDATPQSKFRDVSGASTPNFSVIHTPTTADHARKRRKRKCLLDDVIVFPNDVIKKCIHDASDLVCKRRKAPHTALAAWKSLQVSNLHHCFLQPLIPCASSELGSLFCKKLKIPVSVETVKASQKFVYRSRTTPRHIKTVEPSKEKVVSESCSVGKSVETVKPLERLDMSESSNSCKPVKPVEPPTKLSVSLSLDGGGPAEPSELPEKLDVPVSPSAGRPVEPIEQVAIAPETPIQRTTVLRSFESPERPAIPNAGAPVEHLDQVAIAPETPIHHTTVLRSFESPEISNSDGIRLELETVNGEPSPSKDLEFDFSLMNEEISEGDEQQDCYGWLARTRVVAKCLHRSFLNQKKRKEKEVVNLLQLLEGRIKKESARLFYETLVLKSKGFVNVKQENAYGDILIWKTFQWDYVLEADSV